MKDVDLTLAQTFTNKKIDLIKNRRSEYNFTNNSFSFSIDDMLFRGSKNKNFNNIRNIEFKELTNDNEMVLREFPLGSLTHIRGYRETYQCERLERCERCGKLYILGECQSCEKYFDQQKVLNRLRGVT